MAKAKNYGEVEAVPTATEYQSAEPLASPKAATPVKAVAGDLPRVVTQLTRATEGTTRYKVSCHGHVKPPRYVLAEKGDVAGAEKAYRANVKLDDEIDRMKLMGTPHFDPRLVVVPLVD